MNVARIIEDKGRTVVTTTLDASLAEVAAILAEKRIGAVIVAEAGAIRGILSERDIVRALARDGAKALGKPATEVMTEKVMTCRPDDTIHDVMHKMTSGRFRHLPVVEGGQLVGVISIGDVVKWRIEEVEQEANQIRDYIATA